MEKVPNEVQSLILLKVTGRAELRALVVVSKALSEWIKNSEAAERTKRAMLALGDVWRRDAAVREYDAGRLRIFKDNVADTFDGSMPTKVSPLLASGRGLIWMEGSNAAWGWCFGRHVREYPDGVPQSVHFLVDLASCRLFSATSTEAVDEYSIRKLSEDVVLQKWPIEPKKGRPHPYRLRPGQPPFSTKTKAQAFIRDFVQRGPRAISEEDMAWVRHLLLRHPRALMTWDWENVDVGLTDCYRHFCIRFKEVVFTNSQMLPISYQLCMEINAEKAANEWDEHLSEWYSRKCPRGGRFRSGLGLIV